MELDNGGVVASHPEKRLGKPDARLRRGGEKVRPAQVLPLHIQRPGIHGQTAKAEDPSRSGLEGLRREPDPARGQDFVIDLTHPLVIHHKGEMRAVGHKGKPAGRAVGLRQARPLDEVPGMVVEQQVESIVPARGDEEEIEVLIVHVAQDDAERRMPVRRVGFQLRLEHEVGEPPFGNHGLPGEVALLAQLQAERAALLSGGVPLRLCLGKDLPVEPAKRACELLLGSAGTKECKHR